MSLVIVFSFLVALIITIAYYVNNKYSYFKNRGFEFIKPVFPFGSLKGVGFSVHFSQLSRDYYNQFKNKAPAIGLFFFTKPVVLVLDLDLIRNVLIKDFNYFHDHGVYMNKEADPLSGGLFALEGAEWKNMRSKLSPTFTSGKMKMMFGIVLNISHEMIDLLKKSNQKIQEFEMKDILSRYTIDVIGNIAFGLELNSIKDPNSMFYKMGQKIVNPPKTDILRILFLATFKNFSKKWNFRLFPKYISDFFLSSIDETIKYRETNNVVRNDFLNLLMELKNHGKLKDDEGEATEKLTFEELAAQAFVFFLAGFETSSTTLSFVLYELALNPDIQEKLRNEIKEVISRHDGKVTYEAMTDMKYLQMVIDETLRRYCPLDCLIRVALDDYKIPGTNLTIEKDTHVLVPVYAVQHDADIYSDPEKFDPDRFSDQAKEGRHSMAHMPFGAGNRNCIGLRFALMETKIALINLLLNFKFSPSEKTTIPMKYLLSSQLLTPRDKMWLNIEKIDTE